MAMVFFINNSGVDIGVGVFDINADYTGRFTSSGGKQYDVILDEKQYDYTAKVKPAAESGKHGVFNGIMNTAPGSLISVWEINMRTKVFIS